MYADAVIGNIKDENGLKTDYPLKCYVMYAHAKRELDELDAALGTGRYSQFSSNKPKLPQAVRKAVEHRRGSLKYSLDSWGEFAGLLDGEATHGSATDLVIDWTEFRHYGAQEFVYYNDLPL